MKEDFFEQEAIATNYTTKTASIKGRILIGAISLAFLLGILLFGMLWMFNTTHAQQKRVADIYQPMRHYIYAILSGVNHAMADIKTNIYFNSPATIVQIQENWQTEVKLPTDSLKMLAKQIDSPDFEVIFQSVQNNNNKFYALLTEASKISLEKANYNQTGDFFNKKLKNVVEGQLQPLYQESRKLMQDLINQNQKDTQVNTIWLNNKIDQFKIFIIFALILIIVAIGIFIQFLIRNLIADFKALATYAKALSIGEVPQIPDIKNKEFETIFNPLTALTFQLKDVKNFALQVGEGSYSYDNKMFEDRGELGQALAKMRDGLKKISEEDQKRYWKNEGLAKFGELLRISNEDLEALANSFISNLVKYMQANQGAIFVVEQEDEDNDDTAYLQLIAAYAYNKKKHVEKRIESGQGLVGRAWREGATIHMTHVPHEYIQIRSGLGGANPSALLIVPLKNAGEVYGVVEIASFNPFLDYQIEFVEQIAESMAATIASARVNRKTKVLLEEYQNITETLKAQDETVQQNMEELQATQEEMARTQRETAEKEANMKALLDNTSDAIMAFDHKYKVIVLNRAMQQLYNNVGIYLEIGTPLQEAFPTDLMDSMQSEFDRALMGEKFTTYRETPTEEQEFYYEVTYNPIYNERQRVVGASIFIKDITEQKVAENAIKAKEANLNSLINNTEAAIMAIDKDYNLLVFNDMYKKQNATYQFLVGESALNLVPEDMQATWKGYYDRALAGERFQKVLQLGATQKPIYREYSFNPILNEQEEVIGISVFSEDITETKKAEEENQKIITGLFTKQTAYETRIKELEAELANYKQGN